LFTYTPTSQLYTLSLHDALPISQILFIRISTIDESCFGIGWSPKIHDIIRQQCTRFFEGKDTWIRRNDHRNSSCALCDFPTRIRSEEHTSELQSRFDLVCRLLLV